MTTITLAQNDELLKCLTRAGCADIYATAGAIWSIFGFSINNAEFAPSTSPLNDVSHPDEDQLAQSLIDLVGVLPGSADTAAATGRTASGAKEQRRKRKNKRQHTSSAPSTPTSAPVPPPRNRSSAHAAPVPPPRIPAPPPSAQPTAEQEFDDFFNLVSNMFGNDFRVTMSNHTPAKTNKKHNRRNRTN